MPRHTGSGKSDKNFTTYDKSDSWVPRGGMAPEKDDVDTSKTRTKMKCSTCPRCATSFYASTTTEFGLTTGYCTWCGVETRQEKDGVLEES